MDYGETYAPGGKHTTFRLIISLAARYNQKIEHHAVVSAFLHPDVDDDTLCMDLPEDWPDDLQMSVVRLHTALCGLKPAPQLWYGHINTFLLSLGFIQSQADLNLYIRINGTMLLLLYVDDLLLAYTSSMVKEAEEIMMALAATYKITNLGTAS
jgi:hypothetical protein